MVDKTLQNIGRSRIVAYGIIGMVGWTKVSKQMGKCHDGKRL
jgi:hypothetical protein